jgi:hypothetical protein
MVRDVIIDGRTLSDVRVEAIPPVKDAEVFFPTDLSLGPDVKGTIETVALKYYYGI